MFKITFFKTILDPTTIKINGTVESMVDTIPEFLYTTIARITITTKEL
jgi:hypothetical protein